ncbi:MAG: hypothetical protein VYA34_06410 [Myxococcota bacterium]|nr:hypothetical protein [Myxococcota bacterium]
MIRAVKERRGNTKKLLFYPSIFMGLPPLATGNVPCISYNGLGQVFVAWVFDDFSRQHAVASATEFLIELEQAGLDRRISPTQVAFGIYFGAVFRWVLVRMRGVNLR